MHDGNSLAARALSSPWQAATSGCSVVALCFGCAIAEAHECDDAARERPPAHALLRLTEVEGNRRKSVCVVTEADALSLKEELQRGTGPEDLRVKSLFHFA